MKQKKITQILTLVALLTLLFLNYNLVSSIFFSNGQQDQMKIKDVIIPTDAEIMNLIQNDFPDITIELQETKFEKNKRKITQNGEVIGYTYVVIEEIPCSVCSNVNYLLILDNDYKIKNIVFLRPMIESLNLVNENEFKRYTNNFLAANLLTGEFKKSGSTEYPEKHSTYFLKSMENIRKQAELFHETENK